MVSTRARQSVLQSVNDLVSLLSECFVEISALSSLLSSLRSVRALVEAALLLLLPASSSLLGLPQILYSLLHEPLRSLNVSVPHKPFLASEDIHHPV